MRHTKHLWRAGLLVFCLIPFYFLGLRAHHNIFAWVPGIGRYWTYYIPESFGEHGYYRYDSLREYRNQPLKHAPLTSCGVTDCHQERYQEVKSSQHARLSCQICHEAGYLHHLKPQLDQHGRWISDKRVGKMPTNKNPILCVRCHQRLHARDKKPIVQVNVKKHLEEQAELKIGDLELVRVLEMPEAQCVECHDPHAPEM